MTPALSRFDRSRLEEIIASFPRLRVAVLGDYFLDKYLDVDPGLAESSLETGLVAHQVVRVRHSPGAAGTVVSNLASLGAGKLRAMGFTGDDGEGYELRADLAALGCEASGLHVDASRRTPTYLKPRDIDRASLAGEHSRYDIKNREPTLPELEDRILASLELALAEVDALVVMDQVEDQAMGVLTTKVVSGLREMVEGRGRLVAWADSRRRIMDFHGLVLKMNQFELLGLHDPEPGSAVPDAAIASTLPTVTARSGAAVFATAAERGVWVYAPGSNAAAPERIAAVDVDAPVDPTGAGDSFTAGAVLSLAAGATWAEAALVGNLVASITVMRLGETGVARPEELYPALERWLERNR